MFEGLPLFVLVILLLIFYISIIHPAFMSPLSKIPAAHPLASISSFWITNRRNRQLERQTIRDAHLAHGPVVRLGLNEVSFNSLEALKSIYLGGFERHPWYLTFRNYERPNLISQLDNKLHSQQKRLITNVYSRSFLQRSPELQEVSKTVLFERLIPILDLYSKEGKGIDVLELSQCAAMDMISGYIFGSQGGTNFLQDVAYRHAWLKAYDVFKVTSLKKRSGEAIEQSCLDMCQAAEMWLDSATHKEDGSERKGTKPVVYEMFSQRHKIFGIESPLELNMVTMASELLDHLIAGHESTGIMLTYALYELSLRPDLQAKLREEVSRLAPASYSSDCKDTNAPSSLPDMRALDNLPLLEAILTETLRLHQAVPAPQPRVTPQVPKTTLICNYNIPAGVKVSCNAYTLHRNAEVFNNPEAWVPERWIDCDDEKKKEMRRWFWAFSSGGKMCLGSNFAIQGRLTPLVTFGLSPLTEHENIALTHAL